MSATAPDGSPVGLYATLAPLGEPELDAVLAACARHVEPSGQVLLERMPPDWEPNEGTRTVGGVEMTLSDVVRGGELVSAVMECRADGERWTHAFRAKLISDDEVDIALARAGLVRVRWLDERRTWLEARPVSRGVAG
jgi:hypothetical protein